jgi:hypothetical protein
MANVRPDEKSVAQAASEGARKASEQTETLISGDRFALRGDLLATVVVIPHGYCLD